MAASEPIIHDEFEYRLDRLFTTLANHTDSAVEPLKVEMRLMRRDFTAFDTRLAAVEAKVAAMEARLATLEAKMDALEPKIDKKLGALAQHFDQRFTQFEQEIAVFEQRVLEAINRIKFM